MVKRYDIVQSEHKGVYVNVKVYTDQGAHVSATEYKKLLTRWRNLRKVKKS